MPFYSIKTGRRFTAVAVHDNQCKVRRTDGTGHLVVAGTTERAIKQAACDGAGESFKTLRSLYEAYRGVAFTRRVDLDC
jgi:hypothetical protein